MRVGFSNLAEQRISGEPSVIVPGEGLDRDVYVLVTVGTDGQVIEARPEGDSPEHLDPAPAIAAIKGWRFRPQQFDGKPVEAVGKVRVSYTVPEIPPKPVAFPPADPEKISVTLKRGACFGSCPDYQVTISGNGAVRFSTAEEAIPGASEVHREYNGYGVLWPGVHSAQIDPVDARKLIDRFRQIGFLGLRDDYSCSVTDQSATQLALVAPGVRKIVTDYVGECVGMPRAVSLLEGEIDRLAGTARWVRGTPETLALLEKAGLKVRSAGGAKFAAAVAARLAHENRWVPEVAELLVLLIDRGVPLDAQVTASAPWRGSRKAAPEVTLGDWLLAQAAEAGNAPLFGKLVAKGVLARSDEETLTAILHNGAGCSPDIARALAKAGADARHPPAQNSALTAIRSSYGVCDGKSEEEVVATAAALIELGVPTEARDDLGWTALMGVDSPALARLLLAHGANPNARDKDGSTPLLATDDDRVALILLRAGADPRVKGQNGSVREQAARRHMPATLAWLDAHGVP
jgi:hypothetical protein